jgi:vacuolar-type H+-ATPase subunit E/Vma4
VVEEIKELPLLQMLEEQVVAVKKSPVVEETIKEVKETIEEIPHMPLIKDMEKEVQTRVEQVLESDLVQSTQEKVEELVEKVQEAQSDLQAVKEELVQSVKTLEKKPVRRFFKGIRRNK